MRPRDIILVYKLKLPFEIYLDVSFAATRDESTELNPPACLSYPFPKYVFPTHLLPEKLLINQYKTLMERPLTSIRSMQLQWNPGTLDFSKALITRTKSSSPWTCFTVILPLIFRTS